MKATHMKTEIKTEIKTHMKTETKFAPSITNVSEKTMNNLVKSAQSVDGAKTAFIKNVITALLEIAGVKNGDEVKNFSITYACGKLLQTKLLETDDFPLEESSLKQYFSVAYKVGEFPVKDTPKIDAKKAKLRIKQPSIAFRRAGEKNPTSIRLADEMDANEETKLMMMLIDILNVCSQDIVVMALEKSKHKELAVA